jgi:predicted metal-dependent peptidase
MTSMMPNKDDTPGMRARKAQEDGKPYDKDAVLKRIAKGKTSLILDHPFVGTVALNMPMTIDESIPTAATNGKQVKYNPWFVNELTDEEIVFLVAHECMHPMLEHMYRLKGRDPMKWNMAGDYVINKHLTDDGIGKMIEGGLLSDDMYNAGGGTTDGIYSILPDGEGEGDGDGQGIGGTGNDLEQATGSPAEQEQEANEWKVTVAQAAQAAKMMGKLSASMERFANNILNPKVDWREVLARFIEKCKTDDRSFARPNRRLIQQGLYLPTKSGEQLGELCFAIDVSGSIRQEELDQFAAEMRAVKEDGNPSKIHILYFHSNIAKYDSCGRDDDLPTIGCDETGGTDFAPIFQYMVDNAIEPVATVVLTDMCCNSYGTAPDCPVLWVSTEDASRYSFDGPPFGEVVEM